MKRDKKSNEKRTKARQEAKPKKVMEILGWIITADVRQYITRGKEGDRYFTTLENALWHIAEQVEGKQSYKDLKEAVDKIKQSKKDFLKALSTALHSIGLE